MKRLLVLLGLCGMLLALYGCSEEPNVTAPVDDQTPTGAFVQRPEFIDNRSDDVKLAFTKFGTPILNTSRPDLPDQALVDPNPNPAHKYAYVIGISDYDGTANDLNYCDDDARDVIAYLQTQGFTIHYDIDYDASAANKIGRASCRERCRTRWAPEH